MISSVQATINREVYFKGRGLQTGRNVRMDCFPAGPGAGIVFVRTDVKEPFELKLSEALFQDGSKRRSSIGYSGVQLQTIEHFMSALWALQIDNLRVEVSGPELPATDGSAAVFLKSLKESGRKEYDIQRSRVRIREPLTVSDGQKSITVTPSERFIVNYTIDYPVKCIDKETYRIDLDLGSFEKEIAPARTFCLKREAFFLILTGMGRGANFENTLVLGDKGPVKTKLRFRNEPVRHKVLDLVGDMYMLGMPVTGEFRCVKSGHALNSRLLRLIHEHYLHAK